MIAVILARKNSKRFPGKNHATLGGVSLLELTVKCARLSNLFEEIFISTDDEVLAQKADLLGVTVPHLRPASLALDETSSWDVVLDFVQRIHFTGELALLQVTSPLRMPEDLIECARVFRLRPEEQAMSVRETTVGEDTNYWLCPEHPVILGNPHCKNALSVAPSGACYMISTGRLHTVKSPEFLGSSGALMPSNRSLDLDYDWQLVEAANLAKEHPSYE